MIDAIMIIPGSERLIGEPSLVQREKPEENKGANLDWKP
jgi:hypothetical protein